MNESQGYDVLDAKAFYEEMRQEKMERDMKVRGLGMIPDPENDDNVGFLPRNNVMDRL